MCKYVGKIEIRETTADDLPSVMELWNNGEVMLFVGFPNGIGATIEKLTRWLTWAINKPQRCHFSVYAENVGYCGETFYNVDERGAAALDIKLLPKAQGKGIAEKALRFAIDKAFSEGNAVRAYVEPDRQNVKALILYKKLGFIDKPRPEYLEAGESYMEITKADDIDGKDGFGEIAETAFRNRRKNG